MKPRWLSSVAPLTLVDLASAPEFSSRPMMMRPPAWLGWVLLAVMRPSTWMLPSSASKVTLPACAPVVSMLPLCKTLAMAECSAAACM